VGLAFSTYGQPLCSPQHTKKEALLEQENARRKRLVGELTTEFKKSDALLG
jgi:hypothetical protein